MKRFKIILHLTIWPLYLVFVGIVLFAALQGEEIPPEDNSYYASFAVGIAILPPVLSFYGHYYYLFARHLQKREILLSALFSFLIALGATLAGFLFVNLANKEAAACLSQGWAYALAICMTLSIAFGVVALVLKGFFTWYEELKIKEELTEKTFRMELELVKSQLDPHFLFNTINNIDVLISKDSAQASQYLNQLSDIMRFMLYETKAEEIPLCKELEYIDKYIQLQKIRTANEKYVQYEVVGAPQQQKIAPMVFIPFIENAFKHSTNKKIEQAIDINIKIDDHAVIFKCQNKFEPHLLNGDGYHGLGNELIKKRLNLLYGKRHTLKVNRIEDQYHVALTILNGQV